MSVHLVCLRNKKHVFDSPSLFLSYRCNHKKGSRACRGIMVIGKATQKEFGIPEEKALLMSSYLAFCQLVGLPYKRETAASSRGKKMVWIPPSGHSTDYYYRCAACGALNATELNPDVRGNCSPCDICAKCGIHQFIFLEGWPEYQEGRKGKP